MELRSEIADPKEELDSGSLAAPGLGLLSLAMGLLSPLAIFYGPLMFAPVIALFTGLVSYAIFERERTKSFLKKCVLVSTAVAGITGGWSFAETKFRNDVYYQSAGKFAEEWMQYLTQGKRELAFEMTINEGYRQLASMNLQEFYNSDMKARSALEMLFERPGVKAAMKRGPNAKWKYFSPRGIIKTQLGDVVKVAVQDTSSKRPVNFIVSLMRSTKETTDPTLACWYIMDVEVEV